MSEKDQKKADKEEMIRKAIKEVIEKNNHVLRRLGKKKD